MQDVPKTKFTTVCTKFELSGVDAEVQLAKANPDEQICRELTQVDDLSVSDLVPGKYEGGFKLWEGAVDLLNVLACTFQSVQQPIAPPAGTGPETGARSDQDRDFPDTAAAEESSCSHEFRDAWEGLQPMSGRRVLELGCGHGLPAIFLLLGGAFITLHVCSSYTARP